MNVNGKTKSTLLAGVMTLAMVATFDAHARGLLPDRPSVEIRLEALQHLRASVHANPVVPYTPAPVLNSPTRRTRTLRQSPIIRAEPAPEPTVPKAPPAPKKVAPTVQAKQTYVVAPPAAPKKITPTKQKLAPKKVSPKPQTIVRDVPKAPTLIENIEPPKVEQPIAPKNDVPSLKPTEQPKIQKLLEPKVLPKPPVPVAPIVPAEEPVTQPPAVDALDELFPELPAEEPSAASDERTDALPLPNDMPVALPEPTDMVELTPEPTEPEPKEPEPKEPEAPIDATKTNVLPEPDLDDLDFDTFESSLPSADPVIDELPMIEDSAVVDAPKQPKAPDAEVVAPAVAKQEPSPPTPKAKPKQLKTPEPISSIPTEDTVAEVVPDLSDAMMEPPVIESSDAMIPPPIEEAPLAVTPPPSAPKKEGLFPNIRHAIGSFLGEDDDAPTQPTAPAKIAEAPASSDLALSDEALSVDTTTEPMEPPVEETQGDLPSITPEPVKDAPPADALPNLPEFDNKAASATDDLPNLPDFDATEPSSDLESGLPPLPNFEGKNASLTPQEMEAESELPPLPFGEPDAPVAAPTQSVASEALPDISAPPMEKEEPIEITSKMEPLDLPSEKELTLDASDKDTRLSIKFSASETEVPLSYQQSLIDLSNELIANPNLKIKVIAYASGTEDQKSIAKRISLARSIAVRGFMIDLGISNDRISVQALGNDASGKHSERADVLVVR